VADVVTRRRFDQVKYIGERPAARRAS
jgi:hypothetical protein